MSETGGRVLVGMIGLFIVGGGILKMVLRRRLLKNGIRVPGTVISLDEVRGGGDGERMYFPTFRYVTIKGEEVVYRSNASYDPNAYSEGTRVKIIYDPTEKDNFIIDTFIGNNIGYLIIVIGIVVLFAAVFMPTTAKP